MEREGEEGWEWGEEGSFNQEERLKEGSRE